MKDVTINHITDEEINDSELPETGVCCLCGGEYTEYGNNPDPVCTIPNARCCHKCNWERVLPARGLNPGMSYEEYLETVEKAKYDDDEAYADEDLDEIDNDDEYVTCPASLWDSLILADLRAASGLSTGEAKDLIDRTIKFCEYCRREHCE